jgi:hypothetical protein
MATNYQMHCQPMFKTLVWKALKFQAKGLYEKVP